MHQVIALALALTAAPATSGPAAGNRDAADVHHYFYTAAEAIVHGYEPDTHVRIVSLSDKGTVYSVQ